MIRHNQAEHRATLILLGPALGFLALLSIWPFAYLLYASFTSYQLAIPIPTEWVGLGNFKRIFQSSRFWSSLSITLVFALVAVPLQIMLGMGLALLLNGLKTRHSICYYEPAPGYVLTYCHEPAA